MSEESKTDRVFPLPKNPLRGAEAGVTEMSLEEIQAWRKQWAAFAGHQPALAYAEVFHNAWRALCDTHPRLRAVGIAMPEPESCGVSASRLCWFCFAGNAGRLIRFRAATRLVPRPAANVPAVYFPACLDCWGEEREAGRLGDLPVVLFPPEPRYMS